MPARMRSGLLFTVVALVLVACGGGQEVTLVVGQLGNTALTSQAGVRAAVGTNTSAATAHTPSDAIPSAGDFSYAVIDGIKLTVRSLDLNTADGSASSSADLGGTEIEIGSGVTNVNFTGTISVEPGTYDTATLRFDNGYKLKAFCRTNSHLVYTTATGIEKTACPNTEDNPNTKCPLPAEYGYYTYQFASISTADSPTSTTDEVSEEIRDSITISDGVSANIAVLIDTTALVSCYDGDQGGKGSWDNVDGKLDPFAWGTPPNGAMAEYFPLTQPNFGAGYFPIFISVGGAGDALPTAHTYMASDVEDDLKATPLDLSKVIVTTFALRADGSILAARGRNFNTGIDLEQMFMNFVPNSDGTFRIDNGEWYESDLSNPGAPPGPFADRRILDFKLLKLDDAPNPTKLVDGPDCGNDKLVGEAPTDIRPKDCRNVEETVYWKRLQRDDE